jgi:RNA polymerase sigma-54 factor
MRLCIFKEEYFLDGEETSLKPMILKDITADIMVGLDISTVPRVTNNEICRHAIQEQK